MHRETWSDSHGPQWQSRALRTDGVAPVPESQRQPAPPPQTFTVARYALEVSVGGRPRPLVTETLPLAEQTRRSLLSQSRHLVRRADPTLADTAIWPLSPAFWGKDEHAQPRTGHQHAFFLPADEDGDGRLDHVTVFAPMGFNPLERQALEGLSGLSWGEVNALHWLLIGLGREGDFRTPLLEESTIWISATPFVVTRYPKLRGTKRDRPEHYGSPRDFTRHVLRQELERRSALPAFVSIEDAARIGIHRLRPMQFQRRRSKPDDDGGRRPAGGFRITFAAPVRGPLCIGHSCHFGLGLFLPETNALV